MAPDRNDEYRFYQVLVGAWPADLPSRADAGLVGRLQQFMNKSIKEAKVHTSWINENRAYDQAVARFVERVLADRSSVRLLTGLLPFIRRVATVGAVNSLSQAVLKLASPGVPDVYQGCERWNLSLVDPDNRRPVDFDGSGRLLDEVDALLAECDPARRGPALRNMLDSWADGRIKMCITAAALRLRRDFPETFLAGEYVPLDTETTVGHAGVVAFARVPETGPAVVAIAPRLVARLMGPELAWPLGQMWKTSRVLLPPALAGRTFVDILTAREVPVARGSGTAWIFVGEALETCPVALLRTA
jgi:(1->4)-alpha-D-glucan 1-alpha-D-glucosylmutase